MATLNDSKWAAPADTSKKQSTHTNDATAEDKTATSSMLSGAAATFSPLPAGSQNDATYDTFAQTGASHEEDLFDDTYNTESMQTRPQDDLFADDFTPAAEPTLLEPAAHPVIEPTPQSTAQHTASRGRGRGRGRGRVQPSRQELYQEQSADKAQQAPEQAPTGPKRESVAAVRGDRQATGGIMKPKLSEAELAEKMARISIKNASLAAAHARAEADAASFANREAQAKVAASKRDEAAKVRAQSERKDRQQMMGEREKNRMRKLKAMEGREWDAEKNEEDFSKGGRFDKKGFIGDQADYTDGREYLLHEPKQRPQKPKDNRAARPEQPPKQGDFPALPATTASQQPALPISPGGDGGGRSWAEQVEASAGA